MFGQFAPKSQVTKLAGRYLFFLLLVRSRNFPTVNGDLTRFFLKICICLISTNCWVRLKQAAYNLSCSVHSSSICMYLLFTDVFLIFLCVFYFICIGNVEILLAAPLRHSRNRRQRLTINYVTNYVLTYIEKK